MRCGDIGLIASIMDRSRQKKQGHALLKNCVDPIVPDTLDLVLLNGGDAALARQGSSRDLDHQT